MSTDGRSSIGAARHRIVNDLNLVRALLGLARRRVSDPSAASLFDGTRERVRAIALAYSHAFTDETASAPNQRVDPEPFVRALVKELVRERTPRASKIRLDVDVSEVRLSFEQAITIALLTRELVSNGLDHAFPDDRPGVLAVRLSRDESGTATLRVKDDGVGLPSDLEIRRRRTLGLDVVGMLAEQLAGKLHLEGNAERGSVCTIQFQLSE